LSRFHIFLNFSFICFSNSLISSESLFLKKSSK
jgi:hypothetical protein